MAKKQTSFERVIYAVVAKFEAEHGTVNGAMTWLANGVGVSKQAINQAKTKGRFPDGYLAKISKFTGIPVPTLQGDPTDEVVELSRRWRISVRDTEVALIRIGLDHANRK
jgi:hypothetical protein